MKEKQIAEVKCKGKVKRVELYNVKVLPEHCQVKIPNFFYYKPTVFKNVNLNETDKIINVDYNVTIQKFKIQHTQIKVKSLKNYEGKFMLIYKQAVMPWMTLMFIPVIIIVVFVIYCVIKFFFLKKIGLMNTLIKEHLDGKK